MVLPNSAFDALMWGLLFAAALVDGAAPATQGFVSLLLVVGATYWAAQELAEFLTRRLGWSQDSLATSVASCAAIFLYFVARNSSDFALLVLSIALMMGSLMVTISFLSAVGLLVREGRGTAIVGWIVTAVTSALLGGAAGVAAVLLGQSSTPLPQKLGVLGGALVLWKGREYLAPPIINPNAATPARPALFPRTGTLLDRLVPVAIVGALLALFVKGSVSLGALNPPAVASQNQTASGSAR